MKTYIISFLLLIIVQTSLKSQSDNNLGMIRVSNKYFKIDSTLIGKKISKVINRLNLDTNWIILNHGKRIYGIRTMYDSLAEIHFIVNSEMDHTRVNPKDKNRYKKYRIEQYNLIKNKRVECIVIIEDDKERLIGSCQ